MAGIWKKCYKDKLYEIRGGWKLSKALYAQTIILHDHMEWIEHEEFSTKVTNGNSHMEGRFLKRLNEDTFGSSHSEMGI